MALSAVAVLERRFLADLAKYALSVTAKEKVLERAPHWTEEQAERALRAAEATIQSMSGAI